MSKVANGVRPAMHNLPNYDIAGIDTPERGLELIRQNLALLRQIALVTNFAERAERDNFCNNIAYLKQYYERVDQLLPPTTSTGGAV